MAGKDAVKRFNSQLAGQERNPRYVALALLRESTTSRIYRCVHQYVQLEVAIKEYLVNEEATIKGQPECAPPDLRHTAKFEHCADLYDSITLRVCNDTPYFIDPERRPLASSCRSRNEQIRTAARAEARVLMSITHPHLIRALDYFEIGQRAYVVTEFLRGMDLAQWLSEVERSFCQLPDTNIVIDLGYALLDVLQNLHSQEVTHCDVKPANVILDRSKRRPVLLDLGNAITESSKPASASAGYAPPELYRLAPENPIGPWSDLYMLSALLYRMVTAQFRPPLVATDRWQAIQAGHGDPLLPARIAARPGFTPELLLAIDSGLELDWIKRPQSVEEYTALLAR